jgi:branched-subunit amino acid transport protein
MSWQIWAVIGGMSLTNLVLRLAPIAVLSRVRIPRPVERWLAYVPVSVMAALVATEVLRPGGVWLSPWRNAYLVAALPTAFVYHRTRSLFGATVVGVVSFLAMRYLLG